MYDCKGGNKQLSVKNGIGAFEGIGSISSGFKLQKGSLPQWAVGSAKKNNANDQELEREAVEVSNRDNPDTSKNSKLCQDVVTPKKNIELIQGFDGSKAKTDNEDGVVVVSPSQGTVLTSEDTKHCKNCEKIKIDDRVTAIDTKAFKNFESLSSIDMPNVTEIGDNAFCGCTNLSNIDIPNVVNIGQWAFMNCTNLGSVHMPRVFEIGEKAFMNCTSLEEINMPNVGAIAPWAFGCCTSLSNINIINATEICENGFNGCQSLSSIDIHNVVEIGKATFKNCQSLSNVEMSNVTKVGDDAFGCCTSLSNIDMSSVTKIGKFAFWGCQRLKEVNMPNVTRIGEKAFKGCTDLSNVYIPNTTRIGKETFINCKNLKEISMPNVKEIGEGAFNNCTSLNSINIPNVMRIGGDTFKSLVNLSSVNIQSVKEIGEGTFKDLVNLRSVNMQNVNEIGKGAFVNCKSLSSAEMPYVTKIGEEAFSFCISLSGIYMPNVTKIGIAAFTSCQSLGSVDIPNVTKIPKKTFSRCTSLNSVNMPNAMEIGELAFAFCASLSSVNMPNIMEIGEKAFEDCTSFKKVTLPYYCNCSKGAFANDCEIKYEDIPDISYIDKLKLMQLYQIGKIKPGDFLKDIDISTIGSINENNWYLLVDILYSESLRLVDTISKFKIKLDDLLTKNKYGFDIYDAYIRDWISEDEIKKLMPNSNLFSKMNTDGDAKYYLDNGVGLGYEFRKHLPNFEKLSKTPENIISEFSKNYRGNLPLLNGMRSGIYQYSSDAMIEGRVLTNLMPYMRNTGNSDIKLYRGVKGYETIDYMANMPVGSFEKDNRCILGKEIFDRSFASMTMNKDIAEGYAGVGNTNNNPVFLEITVPKGRRLNMLPIANINDEVVFNKFQKLKVTQVTKRNNMTIIKCEAVEDKENLYKTEKSIYESSEFKKYQEEFELDLGKYLYKSDEAYKAVHKGISIIKERSPKIGLRKIFFSNKKYTAENFSGNVTEFGGQDLTDEEVEAILRNEKPTDEELQSPSTTVAGNLREKLAAFQFAVDDGVLDDDSVRYQGSSEFEPHIERRNRTNEDQEKLKRNFDYQDKELQLFRSARERRYQEKFQKDGKTPITYGEMLFQPQYNRKDIDSFYGKRLVAGTSGTAMRLLDKYRGQISSNKADLLNFRLVLMACMLPEKNHSLYEILQGSHEVGVIGHENLSTADMMDKTIDPLGEDRVRKEVCKDQKFPYERAWEDYSKKNAH